MMTLPELKAKSDEAYVEWSQCECRHCQDGDPLDCAWCKLYDDWNNLYRAELRWIGPR